MPARACQLDVSHAAFGARREWVYAEARAGAWKCAVFDRDFEHLPRGDPGVDVECRVVGVDPGNGEADAQALAGLWLARQLIDGEFARRLAIDLEPHLFHRHGVARVRYACGHQ